MRLGGFQKLTLIDYPGKVASIVFTQGCNLRCGYCHNPSLVCAPLFSDPIDLEVVFEFLRSRVGKIEGVVISGGEPTVQKDLVPFLDQLKSLGYALKLDTNGSNPDVLANLINQKLVDFIAMDIKTSLENYFKVSTVAVDPQRIKESIRLIRTSGLPHQFRTTLVKHYCTREDLSKIQDLIGDCPDYKIQSFTPLPHLVDDAILSKEQFSLQEVLSLREEFQRSK